MAMHRFPKSSPLTPNRDHLEEGGQLYRLHKGRKTKLRGVRYYDSIYYWWYQYLRCSNKYQHACQNHGKGMMRIYRDFGDIFAFDDTPQEFWRWWTTDMGGEDCQRGEYLFGIRAVPQTEMQDFLSDADLSLLQPAIARGSVKLVAVPSHLNRKVITHRFQRLLSKLDREFREPEKARYSPTSLKVDAVSLDKALCVWKMKFQGGMQHAAIAYELSKNPRFAIRQTRQNRDAASGYQYDSRNTVIVRLWKKARKNIEAVERGEFPLGH